MSGVRCGGVWWGGGVVGCVVVWCGGVVAGEWGAGVGWW